MKYKIIKEKNYILENNNYTSFGIKAPSGEIFSDISTDKGFVLSLIKRLNKEKVEPIHIMNILEDIL